MGKNPIWDFYATISDPSEIQRKLELVGNINVAYELFSARWCFNHRSFWEIFACGVCGTSGRSGASCAGDSPGWEPSAWEDTWQQSPLGWRGWSSAPSVSTPESRVSALQKRQKKKTNREFSFHPRLKWAALFWEYARGRKPLPRMDDVLFFNTIKIVGNKVLTMVLIHLWGWERSSLAVYSISFYIFKCIPHAQSLFKAFFTYLFLVSYWTQEQWEAGNGDADAVSAGPFALQQTLMISDA